MRDGCLPDGVYMPRNQVTWGAYLRTGPAGQMTLVVLPRGGSRRDVIRFATNRFNDHRRRNVSQTILSDCLLRPVCLLRPCRSSWREPQSCAPFGVRGNGSADTYPSPIG